MEQLHVLYAAVGGLAVVLALVSRTMRRLPVSEPMLALAVGVAAGPAVLGWVEVPRDHPLLLEATRLLLAASVMAAALRFPSRHLRRMVRPIAVLVLVVMPVMALVSGAAALLLGLPLALAAVVGACLCPTDPVLAASVVSGDAAERDLPARVRAVLTGESGSNDGLALPLVAVAIAVARPTDLDVGRLAWEVVGGVAIGVALGAATAIGVRAATRERSLERGPELVLTLLLTVAVLGVARVAHAGGVLAVFAAGLAYNAAVASGERGPQEDIDEAVNRYAVLPLFAVLGTLLPWGEWAAFGPAAALFVAAVLVLRRLPAVLATSPLLVLRAREATFLGWFGPMGVSALFYLLHSAHEGLTDPRVFAAGSLAIAASVVAFGVSGSPGRDLYARSREGANLARG